VLTDSLPATLERLILPEDFLTARPKRLHFLLLNTLRKGIHHARRNLLRLTWDIQRALLVRMRGRIAAIALG